MALNMDGRCGQAELLSRNCSSGSMGIGLQGQAIASHTGMGLGSPLGALDNENAFDALFQHFDSVDYLPLEDLGVVWGPPDPTTGAPTAVDPLDVLPALMRELGGEGAGSSSADVEQEGTEGSSLGDARHAQLMGLAHMGAYEMPDQRSQGSGSRKRRRTEEEKAQASRDRNREHARNTRQRKKQYVEMLRERLQRLTDDKIKDERSMKVSFARSQEQVAVHKHVLQTFFIYRARGELDRRRWSEILSENFSMKLPVTPYRYFLASDVRDNARQFQGIDALIRDTASLNVMTESLGRCCRETVRLQFFSEADNIIAGGNVLMCRWSMRSENVVRCGGQLEVCLTGMLHAEFGPDHKLTRLLMGFDVMGFMQQLRRCTGREGFQVTPSTLAMAEEMSDEPRMVLSLQAPHRVCSLNQAWVRAYGQTPEDYNNKCMQLLEPRGSRGAVGAITESMSRLLPCSVPVQYCSRARGLLQARLKLFPLMTNGELTHYLATLEPLVQVDPPPETLLTLMFK